MFQGENTTQEQRLSRPVAEMAFSFVMRISSVFALCLAIIIAARLIGVEAVGFAPMRFDLIEPGQRAVLLCTALCAAAAGLGLWSMARWGAILWVATAAALIHMNVLNSDLYGAGGWLVVALASMIPLQAMIYAWVLLSRRALSLH